MKIQAVNAYFKMMDEGRAPQITCGNDRDHTRPFVRLDENDDLVLYCLGCDWEMTLGTRAYQSMLNVLTLDDIKWSYIDEVE